MSSPPGKKTCVLLSILCRKVNSHRCNLLFDSKTTLHLQCGHLMTVVVKKNKKRCLPVPIWRDWWPIFICAFCLSCPYLLQSTAFVSFDFILSNKCNFFAISCECVITKYSRWQILPSNSKQGMFFWMVFGWNPFGCVLCDFKPSQTYQELLWVDLIPNKNS